MTAPTLNHSRVSPLSPYPDTEYRIHVGIRKLVPQCDNITFTMRCHDWERWRSIIEDYAGGEKLKPRRPKKKLERRSWLCEKFGISTTYPNKHNWLSIYFEPNTVRLVALQDMVEKYFHGKYHEIKDKFCLNRVELTWDFCFNHASEIECQNIVKRLGFWLVSIQNSNSGRKIPALYRFTRCETERKIETWPQLTDGQGNLFASYEDCLAQTNRLDGNEHNGDFLIYEQGYQLKDKCKSIFEMNYNPDAQTKTKIYTKNVFGIWVIRCEMTLQGEKLKDNFWFEYRSFHSILDEVETFRFHDFWEFRTFAHADFYYDFFSTQLARFRDDSNLKRLMKESRQYPVTDKIRVMREACAKASKKFSEGALARYSRPLTAEQALNTPIPANALPVYQERYPDGYAPDMERILQLYHG